MTALILTLALACQDGGIAQQVVGPDLHVIVDVPTVTATKPAPQDHEVPGLLAAMLKAVNQQDYQAAAAMALMLVVWLLRKVALDRLAAGRTDMLPWIGLAIAIATGVGVGLESGVPLGPAVTSGILIGLAASGGWSLVGKHVMKVLEGLVKKPAPAPSPEPKPAPVADKPA